MGKRKKKRKKKKIRKLFVTTAAFFLAAVFVVFCVQHILFETDVFNLKAIDILGNSVYTDDYIIEKINVELGQKIFNVDRAKIKETLSEEIYIKDVKVVYELPNRLYIGINERKEKYQIVCKDKYIAVDEEGKVLNIYNEKSKLLAIESLSNVIYNIGETVKFEGVDNINKIFELCEYCESQMSDGIINKTTILSGNAALLNTKYGTEIKIDIEKDVAYQIKFAIGIINERLSNNLAVAPATIDFTKADNPVYEENIQMEGVHE